MELFSTTILRKKGVVDFNGRTWARFVFEAILFLLMSILLGTCIFILVCSPMTQGFFQSSKPDSDSLPASNAFPSREDEALLNDEDEDCQFTDEILSMAKGVDITKLDLFPVSLNSIEGNPGIMSQLIKLTCVRKFTKFDSDGTLISRIPDQFMPNSYETTSAFGAMIDEEVRTERSTRDSKMSLALTVGIDLLKLGMFSSSVSYQRKRQKMITGESYIYEMNLFYIVRNAEFRSPKSRSLALEGNEDFQSTIENLAPTFEEDPASYFDVIVKYGTHYFAIARFGGFVKVSTEVTKRLRSTMSEDEIQARLKASYKMFLKGSLDFNVFENATAKQFMGLTTSSKYSHGGDPRLAFNGDFSQWISSVPKKPRLIGGKLVPINGLVKNGTKAAALQRAIDAYLGIAYVQDLIACLKIFHQKRIGDSFHQRRLLHSLKGLTLEELQNEERLSDLGRQVTQSLRQMNEFGHATVTVFRGGPIAQDNSTGPQCSWIELATFADFGNKTHQKYVHLQDFKTTALRGINPEWNEKFELSFDFKASIQFCKRSKPCRSIDVEPATSNGGFQCENLPIFDAPNRHPGIENRLNLGDFNLAYNIYWEPQEPLMTSSDQLQQPV